MELARTPRHLAFQLETTWFDDIREDVETSRPTEHVGIVVVAFEGQHGIATPLHTVGASLEGTARDEHFVPRKTELALDGMADRVDQEAIGLLAERHHPTGLTLVGGQDVMQAVVDQIGIDKLRLQELRDALLVVLRGLYLQFAILQRTCEAE